MLALFRSNQLLASIVILFYAALLRLSWFWLAVPELDITPGVGNSWLIPLLNGEPLLHYAVTLLLIFSQAILANVVVFAHRLSSNLNLFAGIFVVLVGSVLPDFLHYSGYLVANVFLLLAIRSLLKTFRQKSAADTIFNTGLWLGCAALFEPQYLFLLPALSVTLTLLKSGKFRDQFILLLGMLLPIYLTGIYYFWNDGWDTFWALQWSGAFSLPETFSLNVFLQPRMLVMLGLLLYVLLSQRTFFAKTKMDVQIKVGVVYWLLLGTGLAVLFSMPWSLQAWQLLVPIMGILLGISFSKARPASAEAWHLIMLVGLIFIHFSSQFNFVGF